MSCSHILLNCFSTVRLNNSKPLQRGNVNKNGEITNTCTLSELGLLTNFLFCKKMLSMTSFMDLDLLID